MKIDEEKLSFLNDHLDLLPLHKRDLARWVIQIGLEEQARIPSKLLSLLHNEMTLPSGADGNQLERIAKLLILELLRDHKVAISRRKKNGCPQI